MKPSVGVAFITHNAKHHLKHCLPPILGSTLQPRVLVVNSSSGDGTIEEAKRLGAEVLVVPRKTFNHGLTREQARIHLGTDIIVMMTPDAYAIHEQMLNPLIEPITLGLAAVSYARQIPHEGADVFESFARAFNYPIQSHTRGLSDLPKYGVYTFFCSNSCAAYNNKALNSIGGFQEVLLGEDTCAVASLLHSGERIAYVAEAVVRHSHRYNLKQEFKRNFDTGLMRKRFKELQEIHASDEKRGWLYFSALMKELAQQQPHKIPYGLLQTIVKYVGYLTGKACVNAPIAMKRMLSSQDFYW